MRKKDPNINHVAVMANVSSATVARVFSDEKLVAPGTREKVMEAARMLRYRPNPLARALSGGKTRTIGILWSLGGSPIASAIPRLLSQRFRKRNYFVHVADSFGDSNIIEDTLIDFSQRRFDGVVLYVPECEAPTAGSYMEILKRFRAVVLVTCRRLSLGFDELVHDRVPACCAAADHIVESGRLRPAYAGDIGPSNRLKADAFLSQCRQRGLTIDSAALLDFTRQLPLSDAAAFLDARFAGASFPYDAVMCSNDEYAVMLIAWLRRRGVQVPRDVAVIGFNDQEHNPYLNPPLASINTCLDALVDGIERLFFSRLDNPELPSRQEELTMRFVLRESAGR